MDERAKIPVSPRERIQLKSYWQDPPDAIANLRSTESVPDVVDVVVIGSGITGAAVAWGLLRRSRRPAS